MQNQPQPLVSACTEEVRIVLVEPSHPGNIGGAARAMKTMGFGDLALVRPKRFPDAQAQWRAADATDVLDAARVFDRLEDAIADCGMVAGTSARHRSIPWPLDSAARFASRIADEGLGGRPAAILFGREISGLTNDEMQRCNRHVMIPAHPDYSSLNLAMAVQVVCYEIYQAVGSDSGAVVEPRWDRPLASADEMAGLYDHLANVLEAIGFQDSKAPRPAMTRLRRLFGRIRPDESEVAILRGILTHVERTLGQRPAAKRPDPERR